ncbi:hypothetical protein B0H16DRAFT_1752949 [Mycena metata]|uniref:Uncharacterized protein n=1 Tax=Mycena metata TaxID=1033252 RepID=A0AAD7DDW9_9AGAR|nr:hypothetical protein B0H16DRAFT_1752949 [Mycena metata]
MALRFALLRDYQRGDPSSFRSRTQFEVFFIDLDTEEELVRYLRRPEVSQFSQGVLVPLRDTVMLVRDRFRFSPPIARDSPWIRHQTSIYLRYLGYIRQTIAPDVSLPCGKRVPTPSVASLLYMMRLIRRFGFAGDDVAVIAEHADDDLLIVFNHAHETIFAMAARLADVPPKYAATLSEIQMAPASGILSNGPLLSVQVTNLDHAPGADFPSSLDPLPSVSEEDSAVL